MVASLLVAPMATPEVPVSRHAAPGEGGRVLYGMEIRHTIIVAHFSAHKFCMDLSDPLYSHIFIHLSM